jgi:hypothetical protein
VEDVRRPKRWSSSAGNRARSSAKVVAAEYRTFGEFMATASQFFSMFPVARLSFSKSGNTWRIVFTATGELSVKCLGYFAEEAIKQFGCSVKTSYEGNIIIAEVTC